MARSSIHILAVVSCLLPRLGAAAWGEHGMVAAEHRLASRAGVEILQQGGNAVDAAAATSLAVCVTNPSSCGIGGGGFALIYLAKSRRAFALDYREAAPAAARRDMFVRDGNAVPELSLHGGLAVGVPGEIAGIDAMVRRFGRLRPRQIFAPAIRLARDGFAIEAHLAKEIARNAEGLRRDPHLGRTFLREDGTPKREGEILRRPDLARTLETIAERGPSAFYEGPIAGAVVDAVRASGGVLSQADLKAYRPRWREPLVGSFAGHDILTMPPPSSGGGVLLQILGMLRDDRLAGLGLHTPEYSHLIAESMAHAFADRARYYGDPDFVSVPLAFLLGPDNLRRLRARISDGHTLDRAAYGSDADAHSEAAMDHGTSHLSVLDAEGNAVACTTTINTGFGALLMAGDTGIVLNNQMDDFSAQPGKPNVYGLIGAEANSVRPRKRPLSSMTPAIALRDHEVRLVAGGSGGPFIISGTLQVLLGVLAFDLGAADAVASPRLHDQWMPAVLGVEPGIAAATRDRLAAYGHSVKEIPQMGSIQAVRVYDNILEGASDPRKGGEAVGF